MNYLTLIILAVIALVVFTILWRQGALLKLSGYWRETMEELHKCSWPTWEELSGSTTVVIVSVALLGAFTVGVDYIVTFLIKRLV